MYMVAGVLPRVPLSFRRLYGREQVSYRPYFGLKSYGPYKGVDVNIIHLVPSDDHLITEYGNIFNFVQESVQKILSDVLSMSGNTVRIEKRQVTYSDLTELRMEAIREIVEEFEGGITNNTVVLIPLLSKAIDNPDKFYAKLKAYGLRYNIITQVYSDSGIIRLLRSSLLTQQTRQNITPALLNLALNIFAKAGGVPWTLYNATPYDLTIGISWGVRKVYEKITGPTVKIYGVVSVFDNFGNWEYMDAFLCRTKKDELVKAIKTVIDECVSSTSTNRDYRKVLILTREPFKHELIKGFILELIRRGIFVDVAIVSVMDPIRLYNIDSENYLPDKGVYCIVSNNQAYLATTGVYMRKYYGMGTPRPIKVTLQMSSSGKPKETLRDVLFTIHSLTFLSWRSFWGQIRLPVPLYYSSILSRLMRMLDSEDIENSFIIHREYLLRPPNSEIRERLWFL